MDRWRLYNGVLVPDLPPHIDPAPKKDELRSAIKKSGAYFARWSSGWDGPKGCFWYVIKDRYIALEEFGSKVRYQLRKALGACEVRPVEAGFVAQKGYGVYKAAFGRYKGALVQPVDEERFVAGVMQSVNAEWWGLFHQGRLIGYAQNRIFGDVCNYSVVKLHPDFFHLGPGYALFFEMDRHYLKERGFWYVYDGARSLAHQSGVQEFLIKKLGFRKAYAKLELLYAPEVAAAVAALYPLRRLIGSLPGSAARRLQILLAHEEIRRQMCS